MPEDLYDPEGSVELWVASSRAYGTQEEIVVRGHLSLPLSLPNSVVTERNARELVRLFKDELLGSEHFRHATNVAGVAGMVADKGSVPVHRGSAAKLNTSLHGDIIILKQR